MPYNAGSAFLEIVPSFRGVGESISAEMRRAGVVSGKAYADEWNRTVRAILDGVGVGPPRSTSTRQGAEAGGAFADAFRARVTAALRNLPKPQVGVDATELDAELADIRARLKALSDARVGVDIQAGDAIAELDLLKARLDELGARSPDIRVKVDAAAAATELAVVQAEVSKLDGSTADVRVDDHGTTGEAVSGMGALATAGIALGPAIIPVAGAVAAAVAGIGAGAFAAFAGIGVLAIGLSGIAKAVQELTAGHDATAKAAAKSGAAQVSAAASVANAEQQVADARRGVADAERTGAQSIQAALRRQQDAEETLTVAQRTARQAQLDLSAARQAAKQDLEDLTLQVQDGALAQRQANLDVAAARENLNKVLSDPRSTALQRQQAQLSYDQAVQQVTDLTVRQQRLMAQQAAASKAGVDGAAGVVAATQRVRDTQDAVVKAQRDEKVAAAAVAEARRAAAEAVVKAQERVISAERQLAVAHAQEANAAVTGTTVTKKAFDALGPAGQKLATFIATTVVPAFKNLRDVIQAHLAPGIEQGLRILAPLLPGLTAVAASLATTMGDLFVSASKALTGPFWSQFAVFIGTTIGPNLRTFAGILGNIATGFAGLFEAFAPVATQVGNGLLALSGGFASFGKNAKNSESFQRFLAYIEQVGPQVVRTVGAIVVAVAHIVEALAPLGGIALTVLGGLANLISAIPTPVLGALASGIVAIVVAVKAWSIAQAILDGLLDANPIGLIALALVGLAAAFVYAYNHSKTFRDIVHDAMHVAAAAVDFVREHWKVFAAVFAGLIAGPIGTAVVLIVTHWNSIKSVARDVVGYVTGKFNTVVTFFEKMPGRISKAASGMWDGIKNGFRDVINDIIRWWNSLDFHVPGFHHLGINVNGFDLGVPDIPLIPAHKAGGLATGPQVGLFGEAGSEALLPLTDPRAMRLIGDSIARSMTRAAIPAALPVAGHDGAQALSSQRLGGPLFGDIHVTSAKDERAEVSVPRALRQHAFVSGLWDF